ncbi:MAG: nuclear transport factor 2 family protein [Pseudomonadota bacterium]
METDKPDPRLVDRHYIAERVYQWARAVDRRDWSLVREVFHPDAYDDHGMYKGDVDGLIEWLDLRHQNITRSLHNITNMLIEFTGPDRAVVESYVIAFQRYEARDPNDLSQLRAALGDAIAEQGSVIDVTMPARYVDEFSCRRGDWRIERRTTVFEGRYLLPNGEAQGLDPTWTVGARDDHDPLYQVFRRHRE